MNSSDKLKVLAVRRGAGVLVLGATRVFLTTLINIHQRCNEWRAAECRM